MKPEVSHIYLPNPHTLQTQIQNTFKGLTALAEKPNENIYIPIWSREYEHRGYTYILSYEVAFNYYINVLGTIDASPVVNVMGGLPYVYSRFHTKLTHNALKIAQEINKVTDSSVKIEYITSCMSKSYTVEKMLSDIYNLSTNLIDNMINQINCLTLIQRDIQKDLNKTTDAINKIKELSNA